VQWQRFTYKDKLTRAMEFNPSQRSEKRSFPPEIWNTMITVEPNTIMTYLEKARKTKCLYLSEHLESIN